MAHHIFFVGMIVAMALVLLGLTVLTLTGNGGQ
jgi:hypothetical protein